MRFPKEKKKLRDNCLSLLLSHLEALMPMEQVKFLPRWVLCCWFTALDWKNIVSCYNKKKMVKNWLSTDSRLNVKFDLLVAQKCVKIHTSSLFLNFLN